MKTRKKVFQRVGLSVTLPVSTNTSAILHGGVTSVNVSRKDSRVSVSGHVEPNKVLKKVKSTGKVAEFWPYVPYNLVAYPYVAGAYDKKAPSGFVRNVPQAQPIPDAPEIKYMALFSDENPNACSVM